MPIHKTILNLQVSNGSKTNPIRWDKRKKGKELGETTNFVFRTIFMIPSDIAATVQKTEDISIFNCK